MNQTHNTPVLLLTGYLGSGKTTLLNRILTNQRGIRFAVIVNDIGEVNIDASLIQKGGVVGQNDNEGDLVALQNGCICCTLKTDLIEQINDLLASRKFDYIAIEASGICEPAPIAQTLCSWRNFAPELKRNGMPVLDCIVTVVDALRMQSEFACGDALATGNVGEEDIENLIIEQIEFCNVILLNKIHEVTPQEAARIKAIIRAIQPMARIVECDYCDVPLTDLLGTHLFDFERVATSATWVQKIEEAPATEQEAEACEHHHHNHNHDEDCGCGHHHHHHGDGEAEEYGIQTFVYYRRRPLDMNRFDYFISRQWPKNVIRTKGVIYFKHNMDMSYLFEQAGVQKKLTEAGYWFATAPEDELVQMMSTDPNLARDWDPKYGDRMLKVVFIGQHLDKDALTRDLDSCLA
ncbi:MAG: GTP-binding protein [Paramuribaculum sp.]|nr:GTP-binding protein [Paramuribaculum sp.]